METYILRANLCTFRQLKDRGKQLSSLRKTQNLERQTQFLTDKSIRKEDNDVQQSTEIKVRTIVYSLLNAPSSKCPKTHISKEQKRAQKDILEP